MKTIKYQYIETPLISSTDSYPVLVLENRPFYRQFIHGLSKQIDEEEDFAVYSNGSKIGKLSSDAVLITDLLNTPLDEKKCATAIHKSLIKTVSEDQMMAFNKLNVAISSFLSDVITESDVPLTFDDDFSLGSLLKATNVRPDFPADNYLESLVDRIKAMASFLKKDFFILVGLHQVLDSKELVSFYHEMALAQLDLLLIEPNEPKSYLKPVEKPVVIDDDLCEILK